MSRSSQPSVDTETVSGRQAYVEDYPESPTFENQPELHSDLDRSVTVQDDERTEKDVSYKPPRDQGFFFFDAFKETQPHPLRPGPIIAESLPNEDGIPGRQPKTKGKLPGTVRWAPATTSTSNPRKTVAHFHNNSNHLEPSNTTESTLRSRFEHRRGQGSSHRIARGLYPQKYYEHQPILPSPSGYESESEPVTSFEPAAQEFSGLPAQRDAERESRPSANEYIRRRPIRPLGNVESERNPLPRRSARGRSPIKTSVVYVERGRNPSPHKYPTRNYHQRRPRGDSLGNSLSPRAYYDRRQIRPSSGYNNRGRSPSPAHSRSAYSQSHSQRHYRRGNSPPPRPNDRRQSQPSSRYNNRKRSSRSQRSTRRANSPPSQPYDTGRHNSPSPKPYFERIYYSSSSGQSSDKAHALATRMRRLRQSSSGDENSSPGGGLASNGSAARDGGQNVHNSIILHPYASTKHSRFLRPQSGHDWRKSTLNASNAFWRRLDETSDPELYRSIDNVRGDGYFSDSGLSRAKNWFRYEYPASTRRSTATHRDDFMQLVKVNKDEPKKDPDHLSEEHFNFLQRWQKLRIAADGDPESLLQLVQSANDVAYQDSNDGLTLLHLILLRSSHDAMEKDKTTSQTEVITFLMEKTTISIDVAVPFPSDGETPLILAVKGGFVSEIACLLAYGANQSVLDYSGRAPLHIACYLGHLEIVRLLLNDAPKTPEKWFRDCNGQNFLHYACAAGHQYIVDILLEKYPVLLTMGDFCDWSPLCSAIDNGQTHIVQHLISIIGGKKDVVHNDTRGLDESGPRLDNYGLEKCLEVNGKIRRQVSNFVLSKCQESTEWGVSDIKEPAEPIGLDLIKKITALHLAAWKGNGDVVKLLLDSKMEVDKQDSNGCTALMRACDYNLTEVAAILIRYGANVNHFDVNEHTPLIRASRRGSTEAVRMLLGLKPQLNVNVNAQDKFGMTALHYASYNGHVNVIAALLEFNADASIGDSKKRTPVHAASYSAQPEALRILLQDLKSKGNLTTDHKDMHDATALHSSSVYNVTQVLQLRSRMKRQQHFPLFIPSTYQLCLTRDDTASIEGDASSGITLVAVNETEEDFIPRQQTEVIDVLLKNSWDILAVTGDGSTVLHLAAKTNNRMVLEALLKELNPSYRFRMNKAGHSPLEVALKERCPETASSLLSGYEEESIFLPWEVKHKALSWAAMEHHDLLHAILEKMPIPYRVGSLSRSPSNAIELAACHGEAGILWLLLKNSSNTVEIERQIRDCKRLIKDRKSLMALLDQKDKKEDLNKVWDILCHPPAVYYPKTQPLIQPPTLQGGPKADAAARFEATIVDFFSPKGNSDGANQGFLTRVRTIPEVIYQEGPKNIMEEARTLTTALASLGEGIDVTYDETLRYSRKNFTMRWVHLPANNLEWMKHLAQRMSWESNMDIEQYRKLMMFFDTSFTELPGGKSKVRYMQPNFLHDSGSAMAIYMPYLSFSKENSKDEDSQMEKEIYLKLMKAYGSKIHGSRSLDTFHHPELDGKDLESKDMDQVVTKVLRGIEVPGDDSEENGKSKDGPEKSGSYTILRANQLWIWVLDEKTIISSSTHRMDTETDPMMDFTMRSLNRQLSLAGAGEMTPSKLGGIMIDQCIRLYDNSQTPFKNGEKPFSSRSIRQLFAKAVITKTIEEEQLFKQLFQLGHTEHNGKGDKSHKGWITQLIPWKLGQRQQQGPGHEKTKAAEDKIVKLNSQILFYDIKDICDELTIIRRLVASQDKVYRELLEGCPSTSKQPGSYYRASQDILADITDLETFAGKIHGYIETDLSLEQTSIANKQSNLVMLFTIFTIIFLPMSFLSSFFAIQYDTFQKTPPWVLGCIFGVSTFIFVVLMVLVWIAHIKAFFAMKTKFRQLRNILRDREEEQNSQYTQSSTSSGFEREGGFINRSISNQRGGMAVGTSLDGESSRGLFSRFRGSIRQREDVEKASEA